MLEKLRILISDAIRETLYSAGLLVLRLGAGGMMMTHGWGKLSNWGTVSQSFPDPIGLGSGFALALAIFAELICAAALVLGLATRLVAVPLLITMLVAAFVIHADDPFKKKELALLYAFPYLTFILAGGGRFSLDHLILFGRQVTGTDAKSE